MMPKPLILYIDDEYLNLKMFEVKFSSKYHLLTADNGYSGLEIIASFPEIRIVIVDMKMPEMNGLDFIGHAALKHPGLSYFVVTGYEIDDRLRESISSGLVKKCFTKPLNLNEISLTIEEELCS